MAIAYLELSQKQNSIFSKMHNSWANVKSRFFLVDIGIAFLISILVFSIFYGVAINNLNGLDKKIIEKIFEYPIYIFLMFLICKLFLRRLNETGIDFNGITGFVSFKNIPWTLTLILFQSELILGSGLQMLNTFFVHQFSPKLVRDAVADAGLASINGAPWLLQIIYYLGAIVAILIVAPITEEFIFRGVLMHRWAVKWGATASILLTSAVFGLAHGDIYILPRISLAIISAIAYCNTGLLSVPIVIHALHNFVSLVASFLELFVPNKQEDIVTIRSLVYGLIYTLLPMPVLFYFLKWPDSLKKLPYIARYQSRTEE